MRTLRIPSIKLLFTLTYVSLWVNKEVRCLSVEHTREKQETGGKSPTLARYKRSVIDCTQPGGSGGPITTISRATKVLCNLSVKRTLCQSYCDEAELMSNPTIEINKTYTDGETDLMYYSRIDSQVYIGCSITVNVRGDSERTRLTISCQNVDAVPCQEETNSDDVIPSCYRCYTEPLPQITCKSEGRNKDKQEIPAEKADDDKRTLIGGVIGAVVGVVVLAVGVVVMCVRCRRRRQQESEHESNKMNNIINQEKRDISDDDSSSDTAQDVDQSQSPNQYESITELGTRHYNQINKIASNDDYTYIHDNDLERNGEFTKRQKCGPRSINPTFGNVGGDETDAYDRLDDAQPELKANDTSCVSGIAKDTYNHLGNTNDAYNHASDSPHLPKATGIYNRLDGGSDVNNTDAYNRAGGSNPVPEVADTYNRIGGANCVDVITEAGTYNRAGDSSQLSKARDNYHRLGDVENPFCHDGGADNVKKSTDTYNHLGDTSKDINETDDYNHVGDTSKDINKTDDYNHVGDSIDAYNRLHCVGEVESDTDNLTGDGIKVSKVKNDYNHTVIDKEAVKESGN